MCTVNHHRNRRILRHLPTLIHRLDVEDWEKAPDDWRELDIAYRELRIRPSCMICGDPSGFCRVVEIDEVPYWADLCSEHVDPDHLMGL